MSQRFLVLEWSLLRGMVAMIILLFDVLRSLNFLSLYLQDPHIRITSVDNRVIVLINELTELIPLLENLDGTTYFSTLLTFLSKFLTMLNCKEEWEIKGIMLILSKFVGLWEFFLSTVYMEKCHMHLLLHLFWTVSCPWGKRPAWPGAWTRESWLGNGNFKKIYLVL